MGSAALRVARKDYDDRVIYYEESSAFDSAVIDIEIGWCENELFIKKVLKNFIIIKKSIDFSLNICYTLKE